MGGVGGVVAAALARAKRCSLTIVARGDTLVRLRRHGLRIDETVAGKVCVDLNCSGVFSESSLRGSCGSSFSLRPLAPHCLHLKS